MLHVIECMSDGILWRIQNHSWAYPTHDFTYLLTLFWSVAMRRTVLASSLVFTVFTMVETATGKLCQMLVLFRHGFLLQMMTAIQLYHPLDGLFLAFNPYSFLSLPFHFFTFLVILFPLSRRRLCQGNLHYGCTFNATLDGIVESIHVLGQETLADGS